MNLTPEQIQSSADAVKAHLEGKTVQIFDEVEDQWRIATDPCWNFKRYFYRPKPEPKTRPWSKPDDVPGPVCWMRGKSFTGEQMVTTITEKNVKVAQGTGFSFDVQNGMEGWHQLSDHEYSTDRKTWQKCEVTEP